MGSLSQQPDYVYGWQRTVDPATASEYAYLFAPVENAEAITAVRQRQIRIRHQSSWRL